MLASRHQSPVPRPGIAIAALALLGCAIGSDPNPRPNAPDDGGRPDTGASAPDAGTPPRPDAGGERDAGRLDAGPPPEPDAGCLGEECNGADDDCDGVIDEDAPCPCDVAHHGTGAYMFCADRQSWLGARARCEMQGYSLVMVDDLGEDGFVFDEIDTRGFIDTWIGLNDLFEEGTWVWLDGEPIGYSHWDDGEPNDGGGGGEDCGVIMTRDGRESEWDDRACDGERPYVCEAPAR